MATTGRVARFASVTGIVSLGLSPARARGGRVLFALPTDTSRTLISGVIGQLGHGNFRMPRVRSLRPGCWGRVRRRGESDRRQLSLFSLQ